MPNYQHLEAEEIIATAGELKKRISERFPKAGLCRVITRLHEVAEHASERSKEIGRPIWGLRAAGICVVALMLSAIGALFAAVDWRLTFSSITEILQLGEAVINDLVLLGAGVFFLFTLETRYKRHRALGALHELRSLAHIIDMHQLTKDPERVLTKLVATPSSPKEKMDAGQLGRYLDYCSESLALISKIAALYAQHFDDQVALSAVDQIESLTTGLSRKIWQKLMILHTREA